ncbi:MAG: T9SS type A sorting domain-containing protein [Bacteroidetes bacterium]|nr:T9SS type A sorting domain-containing protein [Bacteroidota bacterium]MBS1935709.1 T9SS type A sorting domain-containing protein [Bacteroidota bacterium]
MRIFYIVISFLLLAAVNVKAQNASSIPSQEPEVKRVKFYPNPATSFITFEFQKQQSSESFSFVVFNFLGKEVHKEDNITPKTIINLTDFPRGIYIFQLKDQNGRVIESGRFQVNK